MAEQMLLRSPTPAWTGRTAHKQVGWVTEGTKSLSPHTVLNSCIYYIPPFLHPIPPPLFHLSTNHYTTLIPVHTFQNNYKNFGYSTLFFLCSCLRHIVQPASPQSAFTESIPIYHYYYYQGSITEHTVAYHTTAIQKIQTLLTRSFVRPSIPA
jgi:hypothetical protein